MQVLGTVPAGFQDLARDIFDCLQREGVINHGVLTLGMDALHAMRIF